jgi:hypothetical protein
MRSGFKHPIRPRQMNLDAGPFVEVTEGDCLLRTGAAAEFLAVSLGTLKFWRVRSHRAGPDFIRVGSGVRYSLAELRRYLKRRTVRVRR